jgi:hypothetical protein
MHFRRERLAAILVFLLAVSLISGCSSKCEDAGENQLPASWSAMQFPVVEGGEICACGKFGSCDEYIKIMHKTDNPLELVDKYSEQLTSNGWTVEPIGTSRETLWVTKGETRLELFFHECFKSFTKPATWSNCEDLGVTKKSK